MFDILSGGLEAHIENDYTKGFFKRGDKPYAQKLIDTGEVQDPKEPPKPKIPISLADLVKRDLIYRINKSDSQYVSENHDNYRKYAYDKVMNTFLYDHLANPERKNGKAEPQPEEWFTTRYRLDYINRMRKLAEQHGYTLQDPEIDEYEAEANNFDSKVQK
jgi:hypothetical protein